MDTLPVSDAERVVTMLKNDDALERISRCTVCVYEPF